MKVIVAGATGVAGQAVVQRCFENEQITKVIILTRKAVSIDVESHPKAQVMMHQDFSRYPDELMRDFEGAEACLWTIGGNLGHSKCDQEMCRKVFVDYTLAAANAMLRHLTSDTPNSKKFRFIFCSCKWAEKKHNRSLLFMADVRRFQGIAEEELCKLADANKERLDVWILRPGFFIPPDASFTKRLRGNILGGIETTQLGKAMVKVGCEGWKERIIENRALVNM